jgi:serine protease inhibitor
MPSMFSSFKKAARIAGSKAPNAFSQRAIPSTEFAFHLFQEMKPGNRNLAICPYGARIALAMLWEGATGETRREMTQGLGLTEDPDSVANHYERLGRPLGFQLQTERRGLEMFTANSLWCDEGFSPKEAYAETLRKDYLAHLQTVNFSAVESPGIVNRWASENTRDRIPRVVDSLKKLSPMMLMNAVYFKGLWAEPFKAELTKEEEFTLPDGKKAMVPMMGRSGNFPYCELGGAQIVRVPYKGGMSMCVVLPPKKMPFGKFCGDLRNVVGTEWTLGLATRDGHLRLPRFRVETGADLSTPLRAMGIHQVFDVEKAALEGISDRKPLYLAEVRQSDFVEVNEEGTEAAAVTSMAATACEEYVPPPPPFEMLVNRPFVFAICDGFSGTLIFSGAVTDPLESGPVQAR